MRTVFCFNGFNQAPIVLRYSAHIKPCKMIKTIKTGVPLFLKHPAVGIDRAVAYRMKWLSPL